MKSHNIVDINSLEYDELIGFNTSNEDLVNKIYEKISIC